MNELKWDNEKVLDFARYYFDLKTNSEKWSDDDDINLKLVVDYLKSKKIEQYLRDLKFKDLGEELMVVRKDILAELIIFLNTKDEPREKN